MVRHVGPALKRRFESAYSRLPRGIQAAGDRFRSEQTRELRLPIARGIDEVSGNPSAISCSCGTHTLDGLTELDNSVRQIVFVWDPLTGMRGSTRLRVFQSANRIASALPWLRVSICPIQSREVLSFRSAIVILHKNCQLPKRVALTLKKNDCVLVADYVDGPHESRLDDVVDGFICSSATEYLWVRESARPNQVVVLVPHGVDDRFVGMGPAMQPVEFRCCYLGVRENGLFLSELQAEGLVEILDSEVITHVSGFRSQRWAEDLLSAPFQYIARPSKRIRMGSFKPFTKGFQAAQLRQLVVGARFDDENRFWLGDDYPFFVEEETIESAIQAVKQAEIKWALGELSVARRAMDRIRRVSCPVQNAIDYREAFIRFSR